MEQFFESQLFLYFTLPLVTVVLSVFLKMVSRNDQFSFFKKEDFAIGLEISLSSLIIFLTFCATIARRIYINSMSMGGEILMKKLLSAPWMILALILGMWGMSTIIRKFGWKSEGKLKWGLGIIIPFLYGILCLYFVVNWMA